MKNEDTGFHHAFDTRRGIQVVQFDATESGDAAALSPDGTTLALFTCGKDNTHPVRLYDVCRKLKEAYQTEELEKFQVRPHAGSNQELGDSEEVNQASFSPDGRLLAVARNDNALHVYDMRALSRGPLCRFEHHDSDAVGGRVFGIVDAKWIQGRDRIGIVSGGNDGGSLVQWIWSNQSATDCLIRLRTVVGAIFGKHERGPRCGHRED